MADPILYNRVPEGEGMRKCPVKGAGHAESSSDIWADAMLTDGLRKSPIVGRDRIGGPALESEDPDPEPRTEVIVELNALYPGGSEASVNAFAAVWRQANAVGLAGLPEHVGPFPGVQRITASCFQTALTLAEADALISADRALADGGPTVIFKIWPDYLLDPLIDRSSVTVKVDAAHQSFTAVGRGVVWAVVDSGIDARHPHFAGLELARENVAGAAPTVRTAGLHRDFSGLVVPTQPSTVPATGPLVDELGHGTHVAGIISGRRPADMSIVHVASSDELTSGTGFVPRTPSGDLAGMAPECELVSLKVFRQVFGSWKTSFSAVMAALEYLRTEVNVTPGVMRVHGVNLSLGCEWDPSHYAAGQSPLCQLINNLVDTGVAVVVSAGNNGEAQASNSSVGSIAVLGSITEPAHADRCITVGSTHRDAPHTFGISWTSSKGPTLDGRAKPDLVAPGEWITSAAAGTVRAEAGLPADVDGSPPLATYAEQSGTSMAAPHVCGVIAGFLSVRPEFIGKPSLVKDFLIRSAVDLDRDKYAQGAGLVDAMKMLTNS